MPLSTFTTGRSGGTIAVTVTIMTTTVYPYRPVTGTVMAVCGGGLGVACPGVLRVVPVTVAAAAVAAGVVEALGRRGWIGSVGGV